MDQPSNEVGVASSPLGKLNLGHVLMSAGISNLSDVLVLRHTYTANGLATAADLTPEKILQYTRWQGLINKVGRKPAPNWLLFMADGARRSRLLGAYENHGEVEEERTAEQRAFDLRPSDLLASLRNRLVVEWSKDAVNWAKTGVQASTFPLVEIADPEKVPFPGFDQVIVSFETLQNVVADSRYADWRTALNSVQGIYAIADKTTGHLYIGKTDGGERLLGRWRYYAQTGHGGNRGLREQLARDPGYASNYQFTILRVFGPNATSAEIIDAETHYKRALLTLTPLGLNHNV